MADKERIYGQKIHKLLQDLRKDRALLTFHMLGKKYERLTIITGILNLKSKAYLTIDYTDGFRERLCEGEAVRLIFQFIGRDKIHYSFTTDFKGFLKNDICINFPEFLDKIQRRRFFRLVPPAGTKVTVMGLPDKREINVVNISEGGALLNETKEAREKPCLKEDQMIRDTRLIGMDGKQEFEIKINESVVRRVSQKSDNGAYYYALQFLDMDPQDRLALRQWIFKCQREELLRKKIYSWIMNERERRHSDI